MLLAILQNPHTQQIFCFIPFNICKACLFFPTCGGGFVAFLYTGLYFLMKPDELVRDAFNKAVIFFSLLSHRALTLLAHTRTP